MNYKSVVLDGYGVNPGDISWDFLDKYGEKTVFDYTSPDEVISHIGDSAIVLTNRMKITEEVLSKCKNVRYVTALGTGYDMIDVEACKNHGVEVCNVPGYSTMSVAQHAFTLLLSLVSDVPSYRAAVKEGKWTGNFDYTSMKFSELDKKTVGIYGCGTIGKRMGMICAAFGMNVIGYKRSKTFGTEDGIKYVDKETLIKESDFISFHCPLTSETKETVNEEFISKMKDGAYIVNTSRGGVINETALYNALKSGKLKGAGLDVMSPEPPLKDNPLLNLDNCVITPHCAWTSLEARLRLIEILDKNIDSFVKTGKGINRVL